MKATVSLFINRRMTNKQMVIRLRDVEVTQRIEEFDRYLGGKNYLVIEMSGEVLFTEQSKSDTKDVLLYQGDFANHIVSAMASGAEIRNWITDVGIDDKKNGSFIVTDVQFVDFRLTENPIYPGRLTLLTGEESPVS